MYTDNKNCDNNNDGDEKVFLTPLILANNGPSTSLKQKALKVEKREIR